ncbi:MAG: DUF2335 domain-containing protein [Oligoflexales bacterium]
MSKKPSQPPKDQNKSSQSASTDDKTPIVHNTQNNQINFYNTSVSPELLQTVEAIDPESFKAIINMMKKEQEHQHMITREDQKRNHDRLDRNNHAQSSKVTRRDWMNLIYNIFGNIAGNFCGLATIGAIMYTTYLLKIEGGAFATVVGALAAVISVFAYSRNQSVAQDPTEDSQQSKKKK